MNTEVNSAEELIAFGVKLGGLLKGGEVIELVGDVGAGKTTLTKGIATGMGIDGDIQSPTFTISRVYESPKGVKLSHYDFYRLHNAGIMATELHEAVNDPLGVTVIEWAEVVSGVLPTERLTIHLATTPTDGRTIQCSGSGEFVERLTQELA